MPRRPLARPVRGSFWLRPAAALDFLEPYFYQVQTRLGYPDLATDHLADLLVTDAATLEAGLLPAGTTAIWDPAVMPDVADWVATEGLRLLFVDDAYDPWIAGAFEPGQAADSLRFDVARGTYGARITAHAGPVPAVAPPPASCARPEGARSRGRTRTHSGYLTGARNLFGPR